MLKIISSVSDPALPLNLSESTVHATLDGEPVEIRSHCSPRKTKRI